MSAQAAAGAETALAPLRAELASQLEALGRRSAGDSQDAVAAASRLESRLAVRAVLTTMQASDSPQNRALKPSESQRFTSISLRKTMHSPELASGHIPHGQG